MIENSFTKVNIIRNNGANGFMRHKRERTDSVNSQKDLKNLTKDKKPTNLKFFLKLNAKDLLNDDDLISRKLEFKLSHVIKGENTQLDAREAATTKSAELFSEEYVRSLIGWRNLSMVGPGLNNLGNTCFLNSVLQSLVYTSPLRNYATHSDHVSKCRVKGLCILCELVKLANFMTQAKVSSVTPKNIVQNIKQIARHLRIGRQEDAHEFLVYFLEGLEKSCRQFTAGLTKNFVTNPRSGQKDNLIPKLFGGEMVSSVTCQHCRKVSEKVDNFFDVSLDIYNCDNLHRAFQNFCKSESLRGHNKYFCEGCKGHHDAVKKFSFKKFPNILVLHLKRFDNFQRKIKKFVKYENELNLAGFVTGGRKEDLRYRLYSVLVHEGFSINSGHYYCYVRNSNGAWYLMNDSWVSPANNKRVMQQTPYILFYERVVKKIEKAPEKSEIQQQNEKKIPRDVPAVAKEQVEVVELKDKNTKFPQSSADYREDVNKERTEISKVEEILNDTLQDSIEEADHQVDGEEYVKEFTFVSKNMRKMRRLLQNIKFFKALKKEPEEEPQNEIPLKDDSKLFSEVAQGYNSNRVNARTKWDPNSIYGCKNIETWDSTEEDSDLLSKQMKFVTKCNEFKPAPLRKKDWYDVDYDQGKLKKVKVRKEQNEHTNFFQKMHDRKDHVNENNYYKAI